MKLLLDTTPEHPHKVNVLVAARCATIAEHLQDDAEGLLTARRVKCLHIPIGFRMWTSDSRRLPSTLTK